jgi:hypothetical protein
MNRMLLSGYSCMVLSLLLAISCAGAPDPAPEVSAEAVQSERANAEAKRVLAADLLANEYFPEDWQSAETEMNNAKTKQEAGQNAEALAGFTEAGDKYEVLISNSLPKYLADSRENIAKARQSAVDSGAESYNADRLARADALAAAAMAEIEAGDTDKAKVSVPIARDAYQTLGAAANAEKVKIKIDEREFRDADPDSWNLAGEKLSASMTDFDSSTMGPAREKAEEALLRYNLVYRTGQKNNATEKSDQSGESERIARDDKAAVAAKSDFDAALELKAQADSEFAAERFDEAAALYEKAAVAFSAARDLALEKRQKAEAALLEAKKRMEESQRAAEEGDQILEGGNE